MHGLHDRAARAININRARQSRPGLGLFRPLARRFHAPRLLPLAAVQRTFASVRALPPLAAAFGVGLLTGLLPCGLSWSAFLLATQASPATAALGLFVFGLATGPALAAVGLGPSLLPARLRARAALLVAPTLVLFGLFTIVRGGLPTPLARAEEALPSCCQPPIGHSSASEGRAGERRRTDSSSKPRTTKQL